MSPFLLLLFALASIMTVYWLLLRYFRGKSLWNYRYAKVEEIQLQRLGSLWSLHLLVSYSYLAKSKEYQGKGELHVEDFLNGQNFLLNDRNGMPHLSSQHVSLIGEEHIETYLIEIQPEIVISVFSLWPRKSKIPMAREKKDNLFQDTSIDFPWK